MSATYGHNIAGSEAFLPERHGRRIAMQRPRQRIEVEPAKADRIIWIICGLCGLFTVLWTYAGGAG